MQYEVDPSNPLMAYGLNILKEAQSRRSPQYFYDSCGDSYISSATSYDLLAVNVKISFDSVQHAQSFENSNSVDMGSFANIKTAVSKASSDLKTHGSIIVTAYQVGGSASSNLAQIFNKSPEGGFYITSCSMEAFENCSKVMDGILDYSQHLTPSPSDENLRNPGATFYSNIKLSIGSKNERKANGKLNDFLHDQVPEKEMSNDQKASLYQLGLMEKLVEVYTPFFDAYKNVNSTSSSDRYDANYLKYKII